MDKELVMYTRTYGCPFVSLAKHVLNDYGVLYREIYIDQDMDARQRVLDWTGFLSVPTMIVAHIGQDFPITPPTPINAGSSPRGIHRGTMITEPNQEQLLEWLLGHGFIHNIEHESR